MLRPFYLILCVLVLISCAKVSSPTGGDKDVTPPVLLKVYPDNESVCVTGDQVVFTFNEYVKLNNVASQLVVSPALAEAPEFFIKKKSIILKLKQPLEPNTTYNFNFGDAIVDVNEGNPLKDFSYVISTGEFLDSLEITGRVEDAYTGFPLKDYTAMLYADLADSTPYLKRPLYLSKSNTEGKFSLRNLKSGNYRLIAVNDASKDYKFQPTEEVAFLDSTLDAGTDSLPSAANLRAFKELPGKLLVSSKKLDGQVNLTTGLSRPCKSCKLIEPVGQNLIYKQWFDSNGDSIFAILHRYETVDSLTFYVTADTGLVDTLQFYPGKVKDKEPAKHKFTPVTLNGLAEGNAPLRFTFPEPIVNLESAQAVRIMRKDSTSFMSRLLIDTTKVGLYKFDFVAEFDSAFAVFWPDSNFIGLYNGYSVADTSIILAQKLDHYGNLVFEITNHIQEPTILLFTDTKTNETREVKLHPGDNKVEFLKIEPNTYQMAIIIDANGNGIWDTGNLLHKIQPEVVIHYKEKVSVRSNWDLDLQWDVNLPETK